ncbi:MAG: efflux RND transporter permease subunit [Janthinobacterium lividum]
MWFTRISINNPVLATMMMVAFVVLGLFSYSRLQVDQFPDITFPVVVIQTDYPDASPETVESDITRKIEEAVNTINGINALTSRSYEGSSVVIIEFQLSVDPAQAAQDVREKVALVKSTFRKEVKESRVTRYDPADRPMFSISVANESGTNVPQRSLRELTTIADQVVKKRLENVRGVGAVTLVGGVKREIQIYVKPNEMEALGIGVDQVIAAVRNENQELPTGAIRSLANEKAVQVQGRIGDPKDFERIVVARRGGQPVTLAQIATVVDSQQEQQTLALYNGQRTLALDILKAQGQNTIEVADGLQRALVEMAPTMKTLYPGLSIQVIKDGSRQIRVGVQNVRRSLVEGAVLTILIVFLFLNSWRSTVITGLTLPVALIGTFLFMSLFGFTINMITLMALSLCVGLLIDDAIVVRENIVRHASMKVAGRFKSHRLAALEGTAEIGLAVLATTLSIVAVFLPVGFMGGIIGRFFHQFGVTVTAAVLISMFVSFTLDPMLSSIWRDPAMHGATGQAPAGWLARAYAGTIGRVLALFEAQFQRLSRAYQLTLAWSLRHRRSTMLLALASFVGGLAIPASGLIGSEFVPQADYSETGVTFYTPVGSSLEFTETKARQVEAVMREFPEVRDLYTTVNTGSAQGKSYATVYARLTPRDQRARSTGQMSIPLRNRLTQIAGITVTHIGALDGVGGENKQMRLSLLGADLQTLARLSEEVQAKMRAVPGVVDLDSSLKAEKPTISITPRRDLGADLGVGVAQIGNALRPLLAGESASTWRGPDDENYDVNVRLAPSDRSKNDDLARLMLASTQLDANGVPRMVPLRQVADIKPSLGANQINRRDMNREVELSANVVGRSAGQASVDVKAVLDAVHWPPGYRYEIGGSAKNMQESFNYALSALVLAVIFIYMILASQFGSFLQPLAIMSALPLTLIGVFAALLLFRSTLNMFSVIGFIMLMGLVTKNAILLVDFANQARKAGTERGAALLGAAQVRLRPILMTTLAMVFGMVPLAFGLSEGSEQRAPMGQAVIGGIITSSILTLVVVPVIYTYLDDLAAWFKRRFGNTADAGDGDGDSGHAVGSEDQDSTEIGRTGSQDRR